MVILWCVSLTYPGAYTISLLEVATQECPQFHQGLLQDRLYPQNSMIFDQENPQNPALGPQRFDLEAATMAH